MFSSGLPVKLAMPSFDAGERETALLANAAAQLAQPAAGAATRVSQVDASRLEAEFSSILLDQLSDVMKCTPPRARQLLSVRSCTSVPSCDHA
jgi:hypothetical protein